MEWHSDGAKGEATILLGLQNVSPDQGSLRVVPGSHLRYVDGIGHDEVSIVIFFFFALNINLDYSRCITGDFKEGRWFIRSYKTEIRL